MAKKVIKREPSKNKFQEKIKMGRPRLIESPDDLYNYWLDYISQVDSKVNYLISAFMNYLRKEVFHDLSINVDYYNQLSDDFSCTKKTIKSEIEERASYLLDVDFHGGRIFNLKNQSKWVDKQEIQQTNTNIELNVKKASDFKKDD